MNKENFEKIAVNAILAPLVISHFLLTMVIASVLTFCFALPVTILAMYLIDTFYPNLLMYAAGLWYVINCCVVGPLLFSLPTEHN